MFAMLLQNSKNTKMRQFVNWPFNHTTCSIENTRGGGEPQGRRDC